MVKISFKFEKYSLFLVEFMILLNACMNYKKKKNHSTKLYSLVVKNNFGRIPVTEIVLQLKFPLIMLVAAETQE